MRKICSDGATSEPWWTQLSEGTGSISQRLLEPLATEGQRLHGAWHCDKCGKISKRIKLNGWFCSSISCNVRQFATPLTASINLLRILAPIENPKVSMMLNFDIGPLTLRI